MHLDRSNAETDIPLWFQANVYGVLVPGFEGRAGCAAIPRDSKLDLVAIAAHVTKSLPKYAQPLFLRIVEKCVIFESQLLSASADLLTNAILRTESRRRELRRRKRSCYVTKGSTRRNSAIKCTGFRMARIKHLREKIGVCSRMGKYDFSSCCCFVAGVDCDG